MDKKLFEEKLSQVAEWHYPKIERSPGRPRSRPVRDPIDPDCDQDPDSDQDQDQNTPMINNTAAPEITRIKVPRSQCHNCGRQVNVACHTEKKFYHLMNRPHWREHCVTCDLWKNPYTGVFDVPSSNIGTIWNQYLRGGEEHRRRMLAKLQNKAISLAESESAE